MRFAIRCAAKLAEECFRVACRIQPEPVKRGSDWTMVEEPFTLASSHKSALTESLRGEPRATTAPADNAPVQCAVQTHIPMVFLPTGRLSATHTRRSHAGHGNAWTKRWCHSNSGRAEACPSSTPMQSGIQNKYLALDNANASNRKDARTGEYSQRRAMWRRVHRLFPLMPRRQRQE